MGYSSPASWPFVLWGQLVLLSSLGVTLYLQQVDCAALRDHILILNLFVLILNLVFQKKQKISWQSTLNIMNFPSHYYFELVFSYFELSF